MSYPKDLDEYTDTELQKELDTRKKYRAMGRCDYCHRPGDSDSCQMYHRHGLAAFRVAGLRRLASVSLEDGETYLGIAGSTEDAVAVARAILDELRNKPGPI